VAVLAATVATAAITVCAVWLNSHLAQQRAMIKDAAVLGYVHSFMAEFTSPDPRHANEYVEGIFTQATGEFARQYRNNENAILVQIAQGEPTQGAILDEGIAKWNDDGSVDVLVITKFTSKSSDSKLVAERENRWVVTAKQVGSQWKISGLIPTV
jgi:Mce-associated membrane protein